MVFSKYVFSRVKVGPLPYSDIMVLAPDNVLHLYVSRKHDIHFLDSSLNLCNIRVYMCSVNFQPSFLNDRREFTVS